MRSPDNLPTDPLGELGKAIKPAAAPAPTPQKTDIPGVLRSADGKLQTDLPEPSWAAPVYVAGPLVWIPTPRDEEQND